MDEILLELLRAYQSTIRIQAQLLTLRLRMDIMILVVHYRLDTSQALYPLKVAVWPLWMVYSDMPQWKMKLVLIYTWRAMAIRLGLAEMDFTIITKPCIRPRTRLPVSTLGIRLLRMISRAFKMMVFGCSNMTEIS